MTAPINTGKSLDQLLDEYPIQRFGTQPVTPVVSAPSTPMPRQVAALEPTLLDRKLSALRDASREKNFELHKFNEALAAQTQAYVTQKALDDGSWVGQAHLDPNGIVGKGVNLLAGALTGASRDLVGKTTALPFSFDAFTKDQSLNQDDINALNNYHAGNATAADMERLNAKRDVPSPVGADEGSLAPATAQMSLLDIANSAGMSRDMARKINTTFDISSIEHGGAQRELTNTLQGTFPGDLAQVKAGIAAGKEGAYGTAAKDASAGIANMLLHVGTAAIHHPGGAMQYVAENAPQLLVGTLGEVGKIGMAASNIGYAADYYQQGMENFSKQNGGQLPSAEEQTHIAEWAASLAVAEHLGDHIGLGAMKPVAKVLGAEAKDAAKTGLIAGIRSTLLSTLEGTAGEMATEGYQGYAEDVTARTRDYKDFSDAALANIYENAAIGGMSGGVLAGGVHGLSTVAGINEHQVEAKQEDAKTKATFNDAVANNTPEVFLNPEDRSTYNPGLAMGVLFKQNQADDIEPLARIENVERAQQIMDDLNKRQAELSDTAKTGSISASKDARAQLKTLNNHIDTAQGVMEQIEAEHAKAMAPQDPQALVEEANAPAEQANPEAKNSIINLSMASTQYLSSQEALKLADNPENGLTDSERSYLRAFSDARIQENALANMGKVSNDVLSGEKKIGGNLGITQYRSRIGAALQTGNQERVQQQLGLLSDFADTHADKAASFAEAVKQGPGTQIQKNDATGKWDIVPATDKARILSEKDLKANGGLEVDQVIQKSQKLSKNIAFEAKALDTARNEMTQAAALRFNGKGAPTQNASPAVQSITPTPASPAKQLATPDSPSATETNTAPLGKLLLEENGKEKTHLETKALDTVEGKPQNGGKKEGDIHLGKTFSSTPEALKYIRENGISATHREQLSGENKYTLVRKNDIPGGFKAARAQKEAQEAKIAEAARNLESRKAEKQAKQAEAEQQASAPAESTVVEASPAVEDTKVKEERIDPLGLETQRTPKEEQRDYQKRNLVADFFTQRVGDEGGSQRPLAAVKDFLSAISPKTGDINNVFKFLPKIDGKEITSDNISPEMNVALTHYMNKAREWFPGIKSNLNKGTNPDYYYKDMSQFLLDEKGDLPQNVKAAMVYSAFSWIGENATRVAYNDDEAINAILRREKDQVIDPKVRDRLAYIGTTENAVLNTLGQRAVQALGLKANKEAPINLQPDLEAAIGAHVMKLLVDTGIVQRNTIKGAEMAQLTGRTDTRTVTRKDGKATDKDVEFRFLALARNEDSSLHPEAEAIYKSTIGSKNIVDKLFGVVPGLKAPLIEPVKVTQTTTKTGMEVPSKQAELVGKENAAEHVLNTDMLDILGEFQDEAVHDMAGKESEEDVHFTRQIGIKAKNATVAREWQRMKDFVGTLSDRTQPFFFEHDIWKMQRVGILTNLINPQGSKLQRQLVYRPSWESAVQMKDMNNFLLRVAEGFGIKTDKMNKADALTKVNDALAADTMQNAIQALVSKLNGEKLTDQQRTAIMQGVKEGGENLHSLSALLAMAKYEQARVAGQTEFKTVLTGEVDGVTNGPMLSHLFYGAASNVNSLFEILNKGGFYQAGSEHTQYNLWRAVAGHMDLYETTTSHMLASLGNYMANGITAKGKMVMSAARVSQIRDSLYYFTGNLGNEAKVEKAGRDIIKTPLTAMVFGSSTYRAIQSMAERFVEAIYGKIEDVAKIDNGTEQETARIALLEHLRTLGLSVNMNASVNQLMKNEFTTQEIKTLQKAFTDTIGVAVKDTIEADFKNFLEQRTAFNKTANTAFKLYNAAYTTIRDAYVQELIDQGKIATRNAVKDGKPTGKMVIMHDMTGAQKAELNNRLAGLKPVMQTAFSQESNQPNAGLVAADVGRELSEDPHYTSEVKFGKPFSDNNAPSIKVHAYQGTLESPGVTMAPFGIHSSDAHMSVHAGAKVNSQNNHDARVTGLNDVPKMAEALNSAAWNTLLAYSPTSAIADTLLNTIQALSDIYTNSSPELSAKLTDAINESLLEKDRNGEVTGFTDLTTVVNSAVEMAHQSNDMKLQAMEQMSHIDQYALEGGHYQVTDADRAVATKARASLKQALTKAEATALSLITEKLDAPATPVVPVATEGKPAVSSTPALVNFFKAGEVRTITEVANQLAKLDLTGFENKLLQAMTKVLGSKSNATTVRYITKDTASSDILEQPKTPSHAWFVSKDNQNVIYVLGTDFQDSGLTKETLLHEMVHATVARAIDSATGPAQALVTELEQLRSLASKEITERGLTGFTSALSNVQEMVAYGMTNSAFQAVLNTIQMQTKNSGNALVSGLKNFIDTLVGLVFGKQNDSASTGMQVLITNVSGLFKATQQQATDTTINLSMATNISDLSTGEVYEALSQIGNSQLSPEFNDHLRNLLTKVSDAINGPFGVFKAQITSTINTPIDAWANAKTTGQVPFASSALASGFRFSEQEAFMAEQVEAAVRAVFDSKDTSTTAAYREMVRLFDDAKEKLTVADFPNQAAYDFVFDVKSGQNNQSDYLSRFAALGLTNEQFNKLLGFNTQIRTGGALSGKTIGEKLAALFDKLLAYINGKLTHTFEGQEANEKLGSLVQTLVDIESKQRMKLAATPTVMGEFVEDTFRNIADTTRAGIAKVGQSAILQESKSGIIKLTGAIVAKTAEGRMGEWADAIQTFRDSQLKQKNGILMGTINEIRGATPVNAMFYKLMRLTKHLEGQRKDLITNTQQFIMESFKDGGKYLTKPAKAAVSAFLRIDASVLLHTFGITGIEKLVGNRSLVQKQITLFENKLNRFGTNTNAYIGLSKALAYKLVTGKITNRAILMNAENIAQLHGLPQAGRVNAQDIKDATPIIDQLVTLYALDQMHEDHKHIPVGENLPISKLAELQNIFKEESTRTDGHGLEFALRQHRFLQDDSKARLFNTSGALAMKGYLPEVYNPYIKLVVANSLPTKDAQGNQIPSEAQALIEQGYSEGYKVGTDKADPEAKSGQRIYTIRNGGMGRYLSGIISMSGMRAKGSPAHNGNLNLMSVTGMENYQRMLAVQQSQEYKDDIAAIMTGKFDPARVTGNRMAPVLNAQGQIVNYRYMMEEQTKDALLERDNRFDQLLGNMAGNTFDKETSADQNRTTIQALHDQYQADYASNAKNYTKIGPDSSDPEMREVWRMLPDSTKQAIREIWGNNNMMVRYDLLDMTFGYRKLSMTDPFGIPEEDRGRFEKLYVELLEGILGKKAMVRVHQFEEVWQALVREAKDTMVVKSGGTLLGNFTSNLSELYWFGVPIADIVKHHRVALKGVMAHRKDSAELSRLQMQLETGSIRGQTRNQIENRINQLKDSMARSPVRELIDAGLMPTIVEDVDNEADQYSFKSKFTEKVDGVMSKVNPHVLKTAKLLTMAHDTPIYQAMSFATQVSDFLARYTLYQHTITRAQNKLDAETAVQLVSDAFVNYDIPSHRTMQYANDMGLVYFSKYYLRIQKVIALLYKQNPGRALMLLTAGHFLDFLPMLTHSAAIHRFGNPFSMGAFESVRSLNEMATVRALMTPFR